jgi:hypothetical protein
METIMETTSMETTSMETTSMETMETANSWEDLFFRVKLKNEMRTENITVWPWSINLIIVVFLVRRRRRRLVVVCYYLDHRRLPRPPRPAGAAVLLLPEDCSKVARFQQSWTRLCWP